MNKNQTSCRISALLMICILLLSSTVFAEGFTSTAMRLLSYEGTVEIEDDAGNPRSIKSDALFNSGEAICKGEDGKASI